MDRIDKARERLRSAEAAVLDAISMKDDRKLRTAMEDVIFANNLVLDMLEDMKRAEEEGIVSRAE